MHLGLSAAASPRRRRGLLRGAGGCWLRGRRSRGRTRRPIRAAMSIATVRSNRHCGAIAAAVQHPALRMRGRDAALPAAGAHPAGRGGREYSAL